MPHGKSSSGQRARLTPCACRCGCSNQVYRRGKWCEPCVDAEHWRQTNA